MKNTSLFVAAILNNKCGKTNITTKATVELVLKLFAKYKLIFSLNITALYARF